MSVLIAQIPEAQAANNIIESLSRFSAEFGIALTFALLGVIIAVGSLIIQSRRQSKDSQILSTVIQQLGTLLTQFVDTSKNFTTIMAEEHKFREQDVHYRTDLTTKIIASLEAMTTNFQAFPQVFVEQVTDGVKTIAQDNMRAYNQKQVEIAQEMSSVSKEVASVSETNGKLQEQVAKLGEELTEVKRLISDSVMVGKDQLTKLGDLLSAIVDTVSDIRKEIDTQTMKAITPKETE